MLTLAIVGTFSVSAERIFTLDREGITGSPDAYTDAIKLFTDIKDLKGTVTVNVAPSVYWLDNPDDPEVRIPKKGEGTPFAIELNCDTLNIIGLTYNPEDVVFAVNRGQTQGAVGNYTMFKFRGKQLNTENITYGNYCNLDLIYPRNPSLNRPKRKDAIVQAQIGICEGTDKLMAKNCRFLSRLNLCPFVGARRTLYDNCYFECTDDALSGSAIYHKCGFTFFSSKPFYSTDPTGAIFLDCDIHSLCNGPQYFTKAPGMVTAIDTRFTADAPVDIRWTRDASDVRCFQSNITLNGEPIIIDDTRRELSLILDDSPLLDAYKFEYNDKSYYNFSNLLNGEDGWDPLDTNTITIEAEKEYGKPLRGIPVAIRMTASDRVLEAQGDTLIITSTPMLWGGFPTSNTEQIEYISDNDRAEQAVKTIKSSLASGLIAAYSVKIKPLLKEAPTFISKPTLVFDKENNKYHVEYELQGEGSDDSKIIWIRLYHLQQIEEGKDKFRGVPIKFGFGKEASDYALRAADANHPIVAFVYPKFKDSEMGDHLFNEDMSDAHFGIAFAPECELHTDFSDVPIETIGKGKNGVWIFDTHKPLDTADVDWEAVKDKGWYYGQGYDASTGTGLVQTVRGARLSYTPERDGCNGMSVTLTAEPAKSGGQGFGSATKQYMDICVKFDTETLTGYALRIERTADHDRAVVFSLIKYKDGVTQKISDKVVSDCYRTPCTIDVTADNGKLTAKASTEASAQRKCCDEVVESVFLSADIEPTDNAGFCIQHTGSTGPSSTLIREVEINWE